MSIIIGESEKGFSSLITSFFRKFKKNRGRTLQDRYPQYRIGKGSYGDLEVHDWGEGSTLCIGAFCSIAHGVKIFLGGEHRTDWVTTYPFNILWKKGEDIEGHPKTKGDVIIGNDVWVGSEAIILSGVTIGSGAVIGARAVVVSAVPPYTVVAGNPARVVSKRFADDIIDRLLEVKWWDWDNHRIEKALPLLLNVDIESFLLAIDNNKI